MWTEYKKLIENKSSHNNIQPMLDWLTSTGSTAVGKILNMKIYFDGLIYCQVIIKYIKYKNEQKCVNVHCTALDSMV